MKKYYILIALFGVLVLSCQRTSEKVVNKTSQDSLLNDTVLVSSSDKLNEKILFMADSVNASISKHLINSLSLNYPFEDSKEKLTLFYNKKQAVKLVYPKFGVTGEVEGLGEYYFNNKGEVFLSVEIIDNKKSYRYIDLINHLMIDHVQASKSVETISKVTECSIIKEIDNFMRLFSTLAKYKSFACRDSGFDLLVHADSIALFESESLKVRSYLPYGTRLKYIQQSSIDGSKYQYLIKVNAEKRGIGWIYLHSDSIIDANELD